MRIKIFGNTPEEDLAIRNVHQSIIDKEKAEFSLRRAEIRTRYWQEEVERLEGFREIRVFDSGGIDYLHTEDGDQPGKY